MLWIKQTLRAFALLLPLLIAVPGHAYEPQKVVYHMNYAEQSRISDTLTNISNHLQALGDGRIDIKVVVHGAAIEYFIAAKNDEGKQVTLDALRLRDVQFIICGNTLDGYNLTRSALYDVEAEDVVQAGLPEIVSLQQQGYIYVRP